MCLVPPLRGPRTYLISEMKEEGNKMEIEVLTRQIKVIFAIL